MQQIALNLDQPQRLTRSGAMLHVVNDPLLTLARHNEAPAAYGLRVGGAVLLVGFDRSPTIDSYDAIVPPFMEASFYVPPTTRAVNVLFPSDANVFASTGAQSVLVEWLPSPGDPFIRQIQHGVLVGDGPGVMGMVTDALGNVWQPLPQTPILDQQQGAAPLGPHLRPKIAPSAVDPVHVVTAANTLFNMLGPNNWLKTNSAEASGLDTRFRVCHRIIVSVSAACLFVVGAGNLAVSNGSIAELGRLSFAAAGTQVIEFGEGISVRQQLTAENWKAYTSAIVTLDATVIGG